MTSYESKTFKELRLPPREKASESLIYTLLQYNGTVNEFGSGNQKISDQIADHLGLSENQRTYRTQTFVKKEGRVKTFPAWNRLLFRAGDFAAKTGLASRPTTTMKLTNKRDQSIHVKFIKLKEI